MTKVKKVTKKKPSLKEIRKRYSRRQKIIGASIVVLALALLSVSIIIFYPMAYNGLRKDRIIGIYDSLNLTSISDDYLIPTTDNVFGDRRVYDWDKSRTFSSERDYIRKADVQSTANELDKAIKAAGYTFFEERYPGSLQKTPTYKSAKGEYIRVMVSSKARDDALWNKLLMNGDISSEDADAIDPNSGPSNVQIKVNLDDNNE